MLNLLTVPSSFLDENCYVAWDSDANEALVVDPGSGTAGPVAALLEERGLTVGAVLLTHGHGDHVWDAAALAGPDKPVYITGPDAFFLDDPAGFLGMDPATYGLPPWEKPRDLRIINGFQFQPVPGVDLRLIPAPGHSPGSAVFLVGAAGLADPLAFSGDVIFRGSVGRTDLLGGSEPEMRQSLRTLSNVMDPATTLLPGHGPQTTWAHELETNAYVRRAARIG